MSVTVLIGLSASGKSHRAAEILNNEYIAKKILNENVEMDIWTYQFKIGDYVIYNEKLYLDYNPGNTFDDFLDDIKNDIKNYNLIHTTPKNVILDGEINTESKYIKIAKKFICNINFEVFNDNLNARLHNSRYYRVDYVKEQVDKYISSEKPIDIPDINVLKKYNKNLEIIYKDIVKKSGYDMFFDKYFLEYNDSYKILEDDIKYLSPDKCIELISDIYTTYKITDIAGLINKFSNLNLCSDNECYSLFDNKINIRNIYEFIKLDFLRVEQIKE